MRLANRHLIRFAAVLALTAASSSAFAQTAEYRRGYDDGFAAGQRAAHDDRGGRGGGGDRLRVLEAAYGARGRVCDARRVVRDAIERNGAIRVNNQLCGDPISDVQKRLEVVYRCGDDAPQRVGAREGETLRLSCRR